MHSYIDEVFQNNQPNITSNADVLDITSYAVHGALIKTSNYFV
jgi:hypothetical protein